jgi:hypothetical protein
MKSAVLAEPLPDLMRSVVRVLRYKTWLAAEILFLCKQLVLYYEQKVRPRPIDARRGIRWCGSTAGSIGRSHWPSS